MASSSRQSIQNKNLKTSSTSQPNEKPRRSSEASKASTKSMLVTGFGMRNVDSLQRALLEDEQRRQMLLHKYATDDDELECSSVGSAPTSSTSTSSLSTKFTCITSSGSSAGHKSLSLQYLMGLVEAEAEEHEDAVVRPETPMAGEDDERTVPGPTLAMRQAQKYLRNHHIFEFFQFLIAHMLSALPEDPIQFLLDLLDKCLYYRSGLGNPPLLFEKSHLEQLFYLMDRMRTGFIELEQYKTGMTTIGVCSYDKNPPLSSDGMVAKETFIHEAYECQTDLFLEMVRRRGDHKSTTASMLTPPPSIASVGSFGQ